MKKFILKLEFLTLKLGKSKLKIDIPRLEFKKAISKKNPNSKSDIPRSKLKFFKKITTWHLYIVHTYTFPYDTRAQFLSI